MSLSRILHHLGRYGPCSGPELQAALGLSQSVFQRAVREAGTELLVVGRARATRYAARREVPGVRTPLTVFEGMPDGGVRRALTLHPVDPFGHYAESHVADVAPGFLGTDPRAVGIDVPWFLQDAAPAGFFGRAWLRAHPDHGFPADLARWQGDHVLRFLVEHGTDAVGAWIVGEVARDRVRDRLRDAGLQVVEEAQVAQRLPELAQRAVAAELAGSSPGGEQPKFSLWTRSSAGLVHEELVKFTAPMEHPAGRRWADLLVAEHLAHETLRSEGIEACISSLMDAGGRRFLRVLRFDRYGLAGRSGLVSLGPLDPHGVAHDLRSWSLVTADLVHQRRLPPAEHERVRWLESFGHAIGNTDMHLGNLSLRLQGTTIRGLAPVYDMLPMFYAPRHGGELPNGLHPMLNDEAPSVCALRAARRFWERLAEDERVSEGFRRVAGEAAARCEAPSEPWSSDG